MRRLWIINGLLIGALALSGCQSLRRQFFPPSTKTYAHHAHAHKGKTAVAPAHPSAADYLEHLALARLLFAAPGAASDSAADDLDALQSYSAAQPPLSPQPVIIFDYTLGKGRHQLAAPIAFPATNADFTEVLPIMEQLSTDKAILHDVRLAAVAVKAGDLSALPDANAEQAQSLLDAQEKHIVKTAAALPHLEDARTQLLFIRFCIDHRWRDAGYLSAENVRQVLAKASRVHGEEKAATELSKQLDTLEKELHDSLPYTLSMRISPGS